MVSPPVQKASNSYFTPLPLKVAIVITVALTIITALGAVYFGLTAGINSIVFMGFAVSTDSLSILSLALVGLYLKNKANMPLQSLKNDAEMPLQEAQKIYVSIDSSNQQLSLQKKPVSQSKAAKTLVFEDQKCLMLDSDSFTYLKTNSGCLKTMFSGKFKESGLDEVKLNGVDRDLLLEVLQDFNRDIDFTENISEKYLLADILQIDILQEKYKQFIRNNLELLDFDNLFDVAEFYSLSNEIDPYLNKILNDNLDSTEEFSKIVRSSIDRNFTFSTLEFSDRFTDAHLKLLSGISCNELDLSCSLITSLECLKNIKDLVSLNIRQCECIGSQAFASLIHLKKLKLLGLSRTQISTLDFLEEMPNLEKLDLDDCNNIPSQAFASLIHLKKLKLLGLSRTQISTLDFLEEMPNLEKLDLDSCNDISSNAFSSLIHLEKLKSLCLRETNVSALDFFKKMTNLEKLDLNSCYDIPSEAFASLKYLEKLKSLKLRWTQISTLDFLEKMPNLERLLLLGCHNITSETHSSILLKKPNLCLI